MIANFPQSAHHTSFDFRLLEYYDTYMQRKLFVRGLIIVGIISATLFYLLNAQFSPEQRYTLFFINKTLAELAVLLIGISYLLGPLCKIIPLLGKHLYLRRYFGLFGFAAVVVHIITSLLQWNGRFPLQWYLDHWIALATGIGATAIFLVLALTSTQHSIMSLGGARWKTIQRAGYIALFFVLVHIALVAQSRWQLWYAGKAALPNSLIVFSFGICIIIVRLVAFSADTRKKKKNISKSKSRIE
mgnify:CR=1 FL=1